MYINGLLKKEIRRIKDIIDKHFVLVTIVSAIGFGLVALVIMLKIEHIY